MYFRGSRSISSSASSFEDGGTVDMEAVGVWREDEPSLGLAELGMEGILVDSVGGMRKQSIRESNYNIAEGQGLTLTAR